MAADRFSPVAPAYIRVLVLPVGRIERPRFETLLQQLNYEASAIPLKDLAPHVNDDELLLSPRAFPQGSLLYNYTASVPSKQQAQLSPFELWREPLLVLGVKDGLEQGAEDEEKEVRAAAEYLRERHPRVVHRQIIVLQSADAEVTSQNSDFIYIPYAEGQDGTVLQSAALQFSARFLTELGTYCRAIQALPGIQTPGQTARSLQRTGSFKEHDKRPPSVQGLPQQNSVPSSPVKTIDESRPKSPPLNHSQAPTSFDLIRGVNGAGHQMPRSDSRASNDSRSSIRNSSPTRVSMQGFGSAASQDKLKNRGKARVGIVMGSVQLLAGQWGEALRMLVEHTSKARVLSDHIWHAKGLESIVACLLLHAWAGLDFQIPSICFPAPDRPTSGSMQRFSVNFPSDFRLSSDIQPSSATRFSTALPELLRYVLNLYGAGEGSLELPFVVIAEATIRFSQLLAVLHRAGGAFEEQSLDCIIRSSPATSLGNDSAKGSPPTSSVSKNTIVDMLTTIYPLSDDNISVADQASILSGTASVYASLQMYRKEAMIIKDLLVKLTGALIQARKKGAAEMGIHPAASLSVDAGPNSIASLAEESGGLSKLMSEMATTYGVSLPSTSPSEAAVRDSRHFGNDALKLEFMKALAAFCEAAANPHGVLRVNAAMLRAFGPGIAVDAEPFTKSRHLSQDEQIRCVTAINRTIGMAKVLGLPQMEADYWDDFLVREVEFVPAEPSQAVADLSILKSNAQPVGDSPANILLYDPNASRPTTAGGRQRATILVQNETSVCRVTLQNPYDVPVDVESLKLVTDGVELKTHQQRFTLKPLGIQRVSLDVSPSSAGACNVTGCIVRMQGCRERSFPIVSRPWCMPTPTLIKDEGGADRNVLQSQPLPEPAEVAVTVIDPQPTLVIEPHAFQEASIMLLDGEICEFSLTIRNISTIPAAIFDVTTTNPALQLQEIVLEDDSSDVSSALDFTIVQPGETVSFTFDAVGKPKLTKAQIIFSYCLNTGAMQYARIITVPVTMTVNAALQVQRLDAIPLDIAQNGECSFVLAFDVGNAWPKPLFYSCFCTDLKLKSAEPRRCHNHEGVLAPGQVQRVFMPVARAEAVTVRDSEPENVRRGLLERLRILWELEDEERKGWVDLSSLAMSEQVCEVVVGAAISLSLELLDDRGEEGNAKPGEAKAGSFVTLRAKMLNRATRSVPLIVQLIPHALNSSDPAQLERRIAIAGAQHRFVPPVAEGVEAKVDFVICPLLRGVVDLEVVVKAALAKDEVAKDEVGPHWTSHKKLQMRVI